MADDLIHPRTRREIREFASGWGVLRTIEDAFEMEGFVKGPEVDSGGQRRSLFDTYAQAIEWSDPGQVSRAVRVFEEILSWGSSEDDGATPPNAAISKIGRLLDGDGYSFDGGRLRPKSDTSLVALPVEHLGSPAAIEEHLQRLNGTGDSDPALAISSAKSIIESTCKHVLEELGEDYDDRSEIPALVKQVQKALKVHPEEISPTAKGRETIIRTLSNLSQVAVGVAELRNEYGPDHGRTRPSGGLRPRHAHLAAGAAQTYCRFLLETLRDRRTQ